MVKLINFAILLTLSLVIIAKEKQQIKEEINMPATGTFNVILAQQIDESHTAGRILITKQYSGDLVGEGKGQMISKRTENGTAAYYAIEEFTGTVDRKKGKFTLIHSGFMSSETQSLDITILAGSGEGELKNISGDLTIVQEKNTHSYQLTYQIL